MERLVVKQFILSMLFVLKFLFANREESFIVYLHQTISECYMYLVSSVGNAEPNLFSTWCSRDLDSAHKACH